MQNTTRIIQRNNTHTLTENAETQYTVYKRNDYERSCGHANHNYEITNWHAYTTHSRERKNRGRREWKVVRYYVKCAPHEETRKEFVSNAHSRTLTSGILPYELRLAMDRCSTLCDVVVVTLLWLPLVQLLYAEHLPTNIFTNSLRKTAILDK